MPFVIFWHFLFLAKAGLPLWSEFSAKVWIQTFSSKVVWKKSDFCVKVYIWNIFSIKACQFQHIFMFSLNIGNKTNVINLIMIDLYHTSSSYAWLLIAFAFFWGPFSVHHFVVCWNLNFSLNFSQNKSKLSLIFCQKWVNLVWFYIFWVWYQ